MQDAVGWVRYTGLAVLTEGEAVVPAPYAQAVISKVDDAGLVLEFPVVVEVRIVPACDPEQHVDTTLARLTLALESWT
jgi:hypothetical protein